MQPHSAAVIAVGNYLLHNEYKDRFEVEVRYERQRKRYTIRIKSYSPKLIKFQTEGMWACHGEIQEISDRRYRIVHDHTRTIEEYTIKDRYIYDGQQQYSEVGGRFGGNLVGSQSTQIELEDEKVNKKYEVEIR